MQAARLRLALSHAGLQLVDHVLLFVGFPLRVGRNGKELQASATGNDSLT